MRISQYEDNIELYMFSLPKTTNCRRSDNSRQFNIILNQRLGNGVFTYYILVRVIAIYLRILWGCDMCNGKTKRRKGIALIICMVFLVIFSALAVGILGMADTNVQLAQNQHRGGLAFSGAQSGLEVMRYWLKDVEIAGTTNPSAKMSSVASLLQQKLNTAGVTNISAVYNSVNKTITIPIVTLDAVTGQSFSAVISQIDPNRMRAKIIGLCGPASKQVAVDFNFVTLGNNVFDYGVATRGPLVMSGQADISGVSLAIEASVYIEGDNASGDAFSITSNASVAGDVSIANRYATYSCNGSVGGYQGSAAEHHIHVGVPYVDFPTPNPKHFLQYATGPEITSGVKSDIVLNNAIIKAGSDVTFSSDIVINGVLYIEQPSKVQFAGKATVNGIIAGDGIPSDGDGDSSLKFAGQVQSHDVSTLTGSQFDAIKKETGTFIVAPGFTLEFAGQSLYMNGAIAANGVKLTGQATGTIAGSLINYSKNPMTMSGKSTLWFNRSGRDKVPAGFEPDQALQFAKGSYSESL